MLFNSITFILFHAVLVLIYWALPRQSYRQVVLLLSSIVFYGWYYWPALFLLAASMVVNYLFSIAIDSARTESKAGAILKVAIVLNLLSLGWFKYSAFIADNLVALLAKIGLTLDSPPVSTWLPLGISFYTFQVIGYLVDIKRAEVKAERNFLVFGVFKCFYGQLVAGPIVRATKLMPQLKTAQKFCSQNFLLGIYFVISGLAIKICIADTLAQYVELSFSDPSQLGVATAWASLYGFAFQILADFWGYSTVAMGLGLMYGIILPVNFDLPYFTTSLRQFWQRWHITLSAWLRDYIYIPLGGNRKSVYRNLILTMLIGGLWHGASWNFIIWGAAHGLWLAAERVFSAKGFTDGSSHSWLVRKAKIGLVFHGVCLLWIFFRSPDLPSSVAFLKALFTPSMHTEVPPGDLIVILFAFFGFMCFLGKSLTDRRFLTWPLWRQLTVCLVLLLLIISYADARLDFIYFVF